MLIWYARAELCEPGLQCWLQSFSIPLSNNTFTHNQATLTIDNMICNNITVPSLSSSVPSLLSLQISTTDIGMNCRGNWHLTTPNETDSGPVGVVISGASLVISISLDSNGTYIEGWDPTCDVTIHSISVEFYNQPTNNILGNFLEDVQSNITSQIIDLTTEKMMTETDGELYNIFWNTNWWVTNTLFYGSLGPPAPRIFCHFCLIPHTPLHRQSMLFRSFSCFTCPHAPPLHLTSQYTQYTQHATRTHTHTTHARTQQHARTTRHSPLCRVQ